MRTRFLLTLLLMASSLCLPSITLSQNKKDFKAAAKNAVKAFFKESGGSVPAGSSRLVATLTDTRITESSGLAASRTTPNVYWTHNDSGDGPYLFALDTRGRTLTRFSLDGATNVDWEDIAIGPGANGKPALYVGDIGDNNKDRDEKYLYRVAEPVVNTTRTMQEARLSGVEKFPFRYPDGNHDAETLMVQPKTGEVYIVTKSGKGDSKVYLFPMPLHPGHLVTLQQVGEVHFGNVFFSGENKYGKGERQATGGDISPDGRHIVIRTYMYACEWDIAPGQTVAQALRRKPRQTLLPLTKQGEAICYRTDGRAWLTTSEQLPTPLNEIPLSGR